jgi:hypothetical protein
MMGGDEQFFAWLDGEATEQESAEMEARVQADPELARLAKRHRAMQSRLQNAFGAVAKSPIPERISAAIHPSEAEVVDFAEVKRARATPSWMALPQWVAIAASLAAGVFVGTMIPQRANAPVEVQGGNLYAAGGLDRALELQLASAPRRGPTRIGVTYRDQEGANCRTFSDAQSSGLACRSSGRWQVRGLFGATEGRSGDYRMAAGMDPNLVALVGSTIVGEPFDSRHEKAAKEHGWR